MKIRPSAVPTIIPDLLGPAAAMHLPLSEREASVRDKLTASLAKLPPEDARELLQQEYKLTQQIIEIRERIAANELDMAEGRRRFDELLPEFREKWYEIERRARVVPVAPSANSATNVETLLMASAYMLEPMMRFSTVAEEHQTMAVAVATQMVAHLAKSTPSVSRVLDKVTLIVEECPDDAAEAMQAFGVMWMQSGFPKLEVSHKLAASLALTDVPDDVEVMAPWAAWSLVVPPGLLGDEQHEAPGDQIARVWCRGSEVFFIINHNGKALGPIDRNMILQDSPHERGRAIALAVDSLVRGCCLALSNPDDYKKQSKREHGGKTKKPREGGAPDFSNTRFMLSAPVTVDLREHLLDSIRGKTRTGGSPAHQFLVRGHWRNQSHGPRHSLRKQLWVHPYWKGDESSRVLLRNYRTKEDP